MDVDTVLRLFSSFFTKQKEPVFQRNDWNGIRGLANMQLQFRFRNKAIASKRNQNNKRWRYHWKARDLLIKNASWVMLLWSLVCSPAAYLYPKSAHSPVHGRWSVHCLHFCKLILEMETCFPFHFLPFFGFMHTRLSSQLGNKVLKKKRNFTLNSIFIITIERKHHCVHLFCCHLCLRGGRNLYSTHRSSVVMFIHGQGIEKHKLKYIHLGTNKYIHLLQYA